MPPTWICSRLDAVAVQERAVARAQVDEGHPPVGERLERDVSPRDVRVLDDDVAVIVASEDDRVAVDEDGASALVPAPDRQPHVVRVIGRRGGAVELLRLN